MSSREQTGVSESLHRFKCTGCTVVSATRAQVKVEDCKALNSDVDVMFKAAYSDL